MNNAGQVDGNDCNNLLRMHENKWFLNQLDTLNTLFPLLKRRNLLLLPIL